MRRALTIRQAGYTLIELAMVLAIAGMLLATAASVYRVNMRDMVFRNNRDSVGNAVAEIGKYLQRQGSYPCPARLDAQRGDPAYGMPGDCAAITVAAGQCAQGICAEETLRPDLPGARVRRGAVPFRVLNIPEEMAYDAYGNRLLYAVTERLATKDGYDVDDGAISISDANGNTTATNVHYALFSAGPDGRGAYTRAGVMKQPCNAAAADGENCNTGAAAAQRAALYRLARETQAAGAAYYDDHMRIFTSRGPLWRESDASGRNIVDSGFIAAGGKIGIGGDTATAMVTVAGDMTTAGRLYADRLCDTPDSSSSATRTCFATEKLARGGTALGMECPPGQYVTRIANSQVECGAVTGSFCPTGQFVNAIYTQAGRMHFSCGPYTAPEAP
jgi:prepilin-type N-terminal cleavage/methylation domain-containing protein